MPESRYWKPVRMNTLVLLRAVAIVLIVANHSRIAPGWFPGGTGLLFLATGISMATFMFADSSGETARNLFRFAWRIARPALLVLLLAHVMAMIESGIGIRLLGPPHSWINSDPFPIWYIETSVKCVLLFGVLFMLFNLAPRIHEDPIGVTFLLLVYSLLIHLILLALQQRGVGYISSLPHEFAWNFILGWFLWAGIQVRGRGTGTLLLMGSVLGTAGFIGLVEGPLPHVEARFGWLMALGLLFLSRESVPIPRFIAHPVKLISRAVYPIYLFHLSGFLAVEQIFTFMGWEPGIPGPVISILVGLGLPTFFWAFLAAVRRTWLRRIGRESRDTSRQGTAAGLATLRRLIPPLPSVLRSE